MSAVQLAMYKAKGDVFNTIIRWWTGSIYSHCELLVNGNCFSSSVRDGGVRVKTMALPSDKWDLVSLPWAESNMVYDWFIGHQSDKYGWFDLIAGQLLGMRRDYRGVFCSEACAKALGLRNATRMSPQGLLDACLDINKNAVFVCKT